LKQDYTSLDFHKPVKAFQNRRGEITLKFSLHVTEPITMNMPILAAPAMKKI